MKRVVVTGATSMIGVALLEECIAAGIEVIAIVRSGTTRLSRIPKSSLITVIEASLDSLCNLYLPSSDYDTFYHFAWDGTVRGPREDIELQWKNLKCTIDAVQLAFRLGCKKFVGAGSQAEYGIISDKIYANSPVNPLTAYGIAKYAAGQLTRFYCDKMNMVHIWGRIFSTYGANDNESTMIKYAIQQFREGKPAQFSAATQKWNYLYEKDAGKIFYLLGEKNVASGVYCVASEDTRPLKDFILEIRKIVGGNSTCEFAPMNSAPTVTLDPDISKTVAAIGWRPKTTFAEGIRRMISDTSK